jgi:hypothetical protein
MSKPSSSSSTSWIASPWLRRRQLNDRARCHQTLRSCNSQSAIPDSRDAAILSASESNFFKRGSGGEVIAPPPQTSRRGESRLSRFRLRLSIKGLLHFPDFAPFEARAELDGYSTPCLDPETAWPPNWMTENRCGVALLPVKVALTGTAILASRFIAAKMKGVPRCVPLF